MGVSTLNVSKKWGSVHSWGIRGVFVEYSRNIHMYRVCVGYVSGMYRESIEGNGEQGGDGYRMQID